MRSFYTWALLVLPSLGAAIQPPKLGNAIYTSAQEAFRDLLDAVPEESLKAALSGLKGWKDGVFETQHRGVELVHDSNPALATKIIVAAVNDLKKRQARPSNSTAGPPPDQSNTQQSTGVPPPPGSSSPPVVIATTTQIGPSVAQTNSVPSTPATPANTNSEGQSVKPTSAGRPTGRTSAASPAPSSVQVLTSTDAQGSTFVTTYTPSVVKVSSIMLITTTGADGKPSTITSYAYVDATATPSATGKPGLQNGAVKQGAAIQVAAACVGALAVFL